MALYPQSQGYSQVAYSSAPQTYHQPAPPPPYYPPYPPHAVFYADPQHFRRDYVARLSQLTFNSRPIIQSLSMIAQEYSRYADIVVQCIEQHIRRVPPWMKLPAFYLLDAISKNVFDPYARTFATVVVRLFLDTYEVVDQATRSKMEEMLGTWRNGAPSNRELFGVVAQLAIERHVWGESAQNTTSYRPGSISTAQVLHELEFVLAGKERALQVNPYDKQTQSHVQILQQLRKLVQAGVEQDELGQILAQLRTLSPAGPAAPVAPAPVPQPYPAAIPSYSSNQPASSLPSVPPYPSTSYANMPNYIQTKMEPAEPAGVGSKGVTPNVPSTSSAPPNLPVNVSSLFSKIFQNGALSTSSTSQDAGTIAKPEEASIADESEESAEAYMNSVLSLTVKLTSVDIVKHRVPIVDLLYDSLPSQCKQCGLRFSGNSWGKKRLEDHLDMHFRQNRKVTQGQGRGFSRSWLVGIDDWLHDGKIDTQSKHRADGSRANAHVLAAEEAAGRDAELRAMTVVVPPGDEAKIISCPICKENLKSEFNEDDEEWVWRNAVQKEDRIYHATCHAEAATSKSTLVTRLRTEASGRSRSRTPERMLTPPRGLDENIKGGSPSPSKLVGTKRKAEENDFSATRERTPPSKKVALSEA